MDLKRVLEERNERISRLGDVCNGLLSGRDRITLEIGCGKGHYLSAYAATFPDEFCVGIDLISARIRDAARRAKNLKVCNAAFVKAEALEFLEAMPEGIKLEKIFIFFPDPWPKTRHHKRRLIRREFLDALRARAAKGARLYFRTDFLEYFEQVKKAIAENPLWELCRDSALPFEKVSQFQRILPDFSTLSARAK